MSKIKQSDKLKLIDEHFDDRFQLFLFKPTLFKLFSASGNMHNMDIKRCFRFLLLLIHGYHVYVLGDRDNNVVACALFANGRTYRYPFADQNDLICDPCFVMPEFRRQGIASKLLENVIDRYETEYHSIYAHIWHTNMASVLCMQKLGFEQVGKLSTTKLTQKCIIDEKGKLILVEKKNPKNMKE